MGARYLKVEDEVIRKYYPTASQTELLDRIPNRSWEEIGAHARRMGIFRTMKSKGDSVREGRKKGIGAWSDADNKRFDMLFPTATHKELHAAFPHRTWFAISSHAGKRHLHRTQETINREIRIGRKNARENNE